MGAMRIRGLHKEDPALISAAFRLILFAEVTPDT
jgi:hypothetical protein